VGIQILCIACCQMLLRSIAEKFSVETFQEFIIDAPHYVTIKLLHTSNTHKTCQSLMYEYTKAFRIGDHWALKTAHHQ
jgi:hypothetical protein